MIRRGKGTGAGTVAEPAVPAHEITEHRYNVHGTGPTVYVSTLYLKGWRPGKQVTGWEYLKAIAAFKGGPMAGTEGTK